VRYRQGAARALTLCIHGERDRPREALSLRRNKAQGPCLPSCHAIKGGRR